MKNNLRNLRFTNSMSISELATKCQVTESYITKIETGSYKISKKMLNKIKLIFNVSDDEIILNKKYLKVGANDVTFINNKKMSIHRWYPYIEGFSQQFVEQIIKQYDDDVLIFDPFNGCGTTTLTCAFNGYKSIATEINPLMRFIANTKVNVVYKIKSERKENYLNYKIDKCKNDLQKTTNIEINKFINPCFIKFDFFNKDNLITISLIKKFINEISDEDIKAIFQLALASILVENSNMIRSVDLRRRKGNEFNRIPDDMKQSYIKKLELMKEDINCINGNMIMTKIIGNNAKEISEDYNNSVDVIITSPPYVNGTNYFRNTKLELWILDFIKDETDIKKLRTNAVTAGINNVSSSLKTFKKLGFVENYAKKLDIVAKDKRIPKLVRAYFSDMYKVFENFSKILKAKGKIYFDIGDSQYYGVYIPVDEIIINIAKLNNFKVLSNEVIRNRKSKNGMLLSQRLIIFEKG